MESRWLTFAKRLQAIGSNGLLFSTDAFDRERFEEIQQIANHMLSELGNIPLERITNLAWGDAAGYASPKVDVRGALIENDRILLVRERQDHRWCLPGGFAEVGFSPSENVAKEMLEEAGLFVDVAHLYSVRHKAKLPSEPDARDFYKLFFLCSRTDASAPRPGPDTIDVAFFSRDNLPELSQGRTLKNDIEAAFAARADPRPTSFD